MDTRQKFLAATAFVAMASSVTLADSAQAEEKEKCYGVAAAGQNHCASADGAHSCAGQATKDGDANEWIYVPKGLCESLAGGSTKPKA